MVRRVRTHFAVFVWGPSEMRRRSDLTDESYDVVYPHSGLCISRGNSVAERGRWVSMPAHLLEMEPLPVTAVSTLVFRVRF